MQCENKRQGLKRVAKGTLGAVTHVHSFWVDFPKPLREREPDSLHRFLLQVWQVHVLSVPGAAAAVPLGAIFLRVPRSWTAAGRPAKTPLAWICTDPCMDHLLPSSVKAESCLHSGTGKTYLCDSNPLCLLFHSMHYHKTHPPNSSLPKSLGHVCWGLLPAHGAQEPCAEQANCPV